MSELVLTLNVGAASLRFSLSRAEGALLLPVARGIAQDLAEHPQLTVEDPAGARAHAARWAAGEAPDHAEAFQRILHWLRQRGFTDEIAAVGHRFAHGGEAYDRPVLASAEAEARLAALAPLAPLQQPLALELLRQARIAFPAAAQVASFDTAFHRSLPGVARRLALPARYAAAGVRRYGFHGLSYAHIVRRLGAVDPELAAGRIVAAHLGASASLCALEAGVSRDTTMGLTPLGGLVMAGGCGDLDPGAVLHLQTAHGLSAEAAQDLLSQHSGLLGVSGLSADLRVLHRSLDPAAREAVELYVYRAAQGIAAMAAALRGLDGLVFTGGVGEHDAAVRAAICQKLDWLGVEIDLAANDGFGERRIDAPTSCVSIWVAPADEEGEIAREAAALVWPQRYGAAEPRPRPPARDLEALLDEALEETFPASDPPAVVRPDAPEEP
jgi:acetate kinase